MEWFNRLAYAIWDLEIFGSTSNRVAEREECFGDDEFWNKKQSGDTRTNFLGTEKRCQYSRAGRRNDARMHLKSKTGRQALGGIWVLYKSMLFAARPPILGGLRYHQFTGGIHSGFMRPQISSEEAFYDLKVSTMLSISPFFILKSIRFDLGSDHVRRPGFSPRCTRRSPCYLFVCL